MIDHPTEDPSPSAPARDYRRIARRTGARAPRPGVIQRLSCDAAHLAIRGRNLGELLAHYQCGLSVGAQGNLTRDSGGRRAMREFRLVVHGAVPRIGRTGADRPGIGLVAQVTATPLALPSSAVIRESRSRMTNTGFR